MAYNPLSQPLTKWGYPPSTHVYAQEIAGLNKALLRGEDGQ